MNEATTKLVEELATKLGTTAEHLWGVLVRQAPITSGIQMVVFACIAGVLWGLFPCAKRYAKASDYGSIICWCLLCFLIALIFSINAPVILSGFYNPEYWALKQVLP